MVRAIMIVEMMGRPAEHLTGSLERHIGVLNDVKDATVHSISLSVPKEVKSEDGSDTNGMLTAFAEADFEVDSIDKLSQIMFDFMPSSVEITEPSNVGLTSYEATALMNNISGRLHRYDEIAKIAGARLQQMSSQLAQAKIIIDSKDKQIEELKKSPKKPASKKKIPSKKKAVTTKKSSTKKSKK